MALIKCRECGAEISKKAESCPKCGAKQSKPTSLFTWIITGLVVAVGWSTCSSYEDYTSRAKSSTSNTGSVKKSPPETNKQKKAPEPPSWRTFSSTDEMTGKTSHFATSPTVPADNPMGFPYHDVTSAIAVGCDASSEWAYFSFSEAPNITDDETKSGYNLINTRIRWDNSVGSVALTQTWGERFLHFKNDSDGIAKLSGANRVMLELKWYGQERPRFSYTLNGSSKAISEIRSKCR